MIDFHEVWLPQILRYADFVLDQEGLRRAWIGRNLSETSVSDFAELYEQVFDDLDSFAFVGRIDRFLPDRPEQAAAVEDFLRALDAVNEAHESRPELCDRERLLSSEPWRGLAVAARAVQRVFENTRRL